MPITRRQREVLDHLSERGAFSRDKASTVYGLDSAVAGKLAAAGVINKRYEQRDGDVYWIRGEGEEATGANVLAGFVVILNRDLTTPSGRGENFFVARARYDGKSATFRRLLRSWMQKLDLRSKDLLGYGGIDVILADSPVFSGDHVILDEAAP